MQLRILMVGLLLLGGASVPAYSHHSTKAARAGHRLGPGDKVLLRGCVEQGRPEFCRLLNGYNVTAANPTIPVGQLVQLSGTISPGFSPCSGTILTDITYTGGPAFCQRRAHRRR